MGMRTRSRRKAEETVKSDSGSETPYWPNTDYDGHGSDFDDNNGVMGVVPTEAGESKIHLDQRRSYNSRIRTNIIIILLLAFVVYLGHLALACTVFAIQALAYHEICTLYKDISKERKLKLNNLIRWLFFGVMVLFSYTQTMRSQLGIDLVASQSTVEFVCFMVYSMGIVLYVSTLTKGYMKYQFTTFGMTHMTLLVVVSQTTLLTTNVFRGLIWFVLPLSLNIINGTSAYVFGTIFGKTRVSATSNKTFEGFACAAPITLLVGFLLPAVLCKYDYLICPKDYVLMANSEPCVPSALFIPREYTVMWFTMTVAPIQLHGLVFGAFASVIGPFGGLFASGIKRILKRKEYGVMPFGGRGGVLDRLDCQLLMATFIDLYSRSFLQTRQTTVESFVEVVMQMHPDQRIEVLAQMKEHLRL